MDDPPIEAHHLAPQMLEETINNNSNLLLQLMYHHEYTIKSIEELLVFNDTLVQKHIIMLKHPLKEKLKMMYTISIIRGTLIYINYTKNTIITIINDNNSYIFEIKSKDLLLDTLQKIAKNKAMKGGDPHDMGMDILFPTMRGEDFYLYTYESQRYNNIDMVISTIANILINSVLEANNIFTIRRYLYNREK